MFPDGNQYLDKEEQKRTRSWSYPFGVCLFHDPFSTWVWTWLQSPPAGCVHTGNAATLSVLCFVELCSKREAGCAHPSLGTKTAVFRPDVPSVSGQPHYRRTKSRLFGRKKSDLPEQIYKNFMDRRWIFLNSKWLIFIVLEINFCFFSPFFLLPFFGCVWTWWTWLLSHISGQ